MKVGVVYPQTELGGDPAALDRFARSVEDMGFDHLLMYDHVAATATVERDPPVGLQPYNEADPFHDPLVAFGYIAAITRRIELITGILILPQRQTLLVARQAADVDLLSGGRLRLGVGLGWSYPEYDAMGADFSKRGPRLSEQIPYLRKLWTEPLLSYEGRFDRIDRLCLNPRPKRQIPIYCGGFSEPAYRRAAKLADGFIFAGDVNYAISSWDLIRGLLEAEGRSVADFRPLYIVQQQGGRGATIEEAAEGLRRWQDAGGTHASLVTMGLDLGPIDAHLDFIASIKARAGL